MKLFLDTSVLLAASGSERGASRAVFERASAAGWVLVTTPYVLEETLVNLPKLSTEAAGAWAVLRPRLVVADDILTLDRPVIFDPAKDRPILFGALAWADVLLTLDRGDFGSFIGGAFYDLLVLTPGMFLQRELTAGRLVL